MAKPSPSHSQDIALIAIGSAIRISRQKLKMSQENLALIAGLDRSYVGGIERGEHNLSILNLLKIAKALKMKMSDFFELSDL